jgi:hypothetical protein
LRGGGQGRDQRREEPGILRAGVGSVHTVAVRLRLARYGREDRGVVRSGQHDCKVPLMLA